MRAVLNATDTAYYLSLSEGEIRELITRGQIPYRRLGRTYLFLIRDLEAWFNALPGVSVYEALAATPPVERTGEAPTPLRRAQAGGG